MFGIHEFTGVINPPEAGIIAVSRAGMTGVLVPHWPASAEATRAAYRVVDNLHGAREVLAALLTPTGG